MKRRYSTSRYCQKSNSGKLISQTSSSTNNAGEGPSRAFQASSMNPQVFEKDVLKEGSCNECERPLINNTTDDQTTEEEQVAKITVLGIFGSSLGEKIVSHYKRRPCFKKIDTFCARIRQDILKSHSIEKNIISQGYAWVVKDFIFVFIRILNAWNVIKDYANLKPERSLNKLKSGMSPDFVKSFTAWEEATSDFLPELICSFVNLDRLIQTKSALLKNKPNESFAASPRKLVNEFEQQQQQQQQQNHEVNFLNGDILNTMNELIKMFDNLKMNPNVCKGIPTSVCTENKDNDVKINQNVNITNNLEDDIHEEYQSIIGTTPNPEIQSENHNLANTYLRLYFQRTYSPESVIPTQDKNFMFDKLCDVLLEFHPEYFYEKDNLKRQFPYFAEIYAPCFPSTKEIVIKMSLNNYKSVYDVIHDLRTIIYFGRAYLCNASDEGLKSYLDKFETKINNALKGDTFNKYTFDHIKGEPGEVYEARLFYQEG